MKKQTISILICLALMSLACLQTAMVAQDGGGETATPVVSVTSDGRAPTHPYRAPGVSQPGEGDQSPERCAVVVASRSLNLRDGANEHAQIVDWLKRGDLVRVIDQSDPEWWGIVFGNLSGFVKAEYLAERECE